MAEEAKKLGNYLKISYGMADMGFIFMVTMSNTYLLMFYTDVAGIAVAAAGTLMMVGRIIDSISPPIIGGVIEKSSLPYGKYRSWVLIGAPLIFLLNALMFKSNDIPMPVKAVVACVVYAAFCIATNIAYTGYTSLNSSLTSDPKERVQLSMVRGQGNAIGKSLAGFFILPLITFVGGGLNDTGFFWTAVIAGGFCLLLYLNLIYATRGRDIPSVKAEGQAEKEKLKVSEMVRLVFGNTNLLLLFGADVARILSMLVMYAMIPYFFKYVVNDVNGAAPFFGIVNILAFLGATSVPFVTRFLSKRNAYIAGNLLLAFCMILSSVFGGINVTLIIVLISVGYIGYSWGNVVNTSMYADTVDYGEWKTGKNTRGLCFSMFQLSIKIAAVFSTAIAGYGLALAGFVPNTEPTEKVIRGIRVISMGLPAALLILGAVLLCFYNLNQKKMEEIRKDLETRKDKN